MKWARPQWAYSQICIRNILTFYTNNTWCDPRLLAQLGYRHVSDMLTVKTPSFWNKEHGKLWWIQIKINYLVPFKRSWQTWNILTFLFSLFWLNCHCCPSWRGSCGQHGAHLGSVGPSWARVGPMNFAIRDCYHYRHHHYVFFAVCCNFLLLMYPSVCHWSNYYSH